MNQDKLKVLQDRMIEQVQDYAFILLDPDGKVLSWNLGAEKIKGYGKEEIVGQSFEVFYTPVDREAGLPQRLLERACREGIADHIGERLRKDGTVIWEHVHITALKEGSEVTGFSLVTRESIRRSPK